MITTEPNPPQHEVEAFSLKDAPSLIERLWPAQKLSYEAQKERKAGAGQTLTSLGSYWKGRKPLILVRGCILGALLPATDNPQKDLEIFEALMLMDERAFVERNKIRSAYEYARLGLEYGALTPAQLPEYFYIREAKNGSKSIPPLNEVDIARHRRSIDWHPTFQSGGWKEVATKILAKVPYAEKVNDGNRPEFLEMADNGAYDHVWESVNSHLRTKAFSIPQLVEQLGIMRYGHRPRVADTFSGGGSIPFEAARVGCDAYASDLNPIACMLTWGDFKIIGGGRETSLRFQQQQFRLASMVRTEIDRLGVEIDENGNRAKAYLYCLETKCPSSGWMVPMLPSLVVSKTRRVIAQLVPNFQARRYDINIVSGVNENAMRLAETGTVQAGSLVHSINGMEHRTSIKTIRGDRQNADTASSNSLRPWSREEFYPRTDDIFQERLYCIQWTTAESIGGSRQESFFASPTEADEKREAIVRETVAANIQAWQRDGLIPDMMIEPGEKTDEPIRTRGWTHWHHLFGPRDLLIFALYRSAIAEHVGMSDAAALTAITAKALEWSCRLTKWDPNLGCDKITNVFSNQALNTFYNYGSRATPYIENHTTAEIKGLNLPPTDQIVINAPARDVRSFNDIYVTDPPYADAVHYHEITEFFIAWLRKNPPAPFNQWTWDSRRPLAIKGDGEDFRREMVAAYKAMADHMPDNGVQIVMFTHQSGSVWADMAQIFWGAGLQVQAAWYIATETTSELKKGGYVQGTVILVLRKRRGDEAGYEDEIAQEVRAEVARQIDTLVGLNQSLKGAGRIENLFEDADLQMAGYAAALRVLTGYTRIDGRDMTAEAIRPRRKGEKGFVERVIEFAVQVANEHMVPEGLTPRLWQQLSGTERFYLKMLDLEAADLKKLDNYQNFARAFRVPDYTALMADMRPNAARVKRADDFKHRTGFDIIDFGQGVVRAALYGIYQISREVEPDVVMEQVRGMVENYYRRREDLMEIAEYIASQRGRDDEREGRHAAILAQLVRNERLG